jgi:hypothetical protein
MHFDNYCSFKQAYGNSSNLIVPPRKENIFCNSCKTNEKIVIGFQQGDDTVIKTKTKCDICRLYCCLKCQTKTKHNLIVCKECLNNSENICGACNEVMRITQHTKMCKCYKKICEFCEYKSICSNSYYFNDKKLGCSSKYYYCKSCKITHQNEPCNICNKKKDYCMKCPTCNINVCKECITPYSACHLYDSCTNCYQKHFIPCNDSNCKVISCSKKIISKCEECNIDIYHFPKKISYKTITCDKCFKTNKSIVVYLCCLCTSDNENKYSNLYVKFTKKLPTVLVNILEQYISHFIQFSIKCERCSEYTCSKHLHSKKCKKHLEKIRRGTLCTEIDYDIGFLFNT